MNSSGDDAHIPFLPDFNGNASLCFFLYLCVRFQFSMCACAHPQKQSLDYSLWAVVDHISRVLRPWVKLQLCLFTQLYGLWQVPNLSGTYSALL